MGQLTIITNRQPRELVSLNDIPRRFHSDFDHLDGEEKYTPRLVKYKRIYYDVGEFVRTPQDEAPRQNLNQLSAWDGYQSDSYFSGVVIKWCDDYERVIVGRYYS